MKLFKSLQVLSLLLVVFFVAGCSLKQNSEDIKKNFPESLPVEYTNLQPQYEDTDAAVTIFTYTVSDNFSLSSVKDQILNKKYGNSSFEMVKESENELVLHQPTTYSGPGGFNEYRILFNKDKKFVTVMFANLDSEAERKHYDEYIAEQDKINQQK